MKYLVTGATGAIGRRLLSRLQSASLLSRDQERAQQVVGPEHVVYPWDAVTPPPEEAIAGADCIVHLAGEPVSGTRWSTQQKDRIRGSRINGTRALVDGILSSDHPPTVLVSASAIGYYGDRGNEVLTEASQPDATFMARLCVDWETEAMRAEEAGVRVVCLRIGIVLDPDSGALKQMLPVFRMGVGGTLGSGAQWMSWIYLDDVVSLIRYVAEHNDISGPVNAVGPHPVTNRVFTKRLGAHLKRPSFLPVPRFAVSLAFGEMADIVFSSQRVMPEVALDHGFEFSQQTLDDAFAACLGEGTTEVRL